MSGKTKNTARTSATRKTQTPQITISVAATSDQIANRKGCAMAERKNVVPRVPAVLDMLREPEKYFDAKFTSDEYEMLRDKIIQASGISKEQWYWDVEDPTVNELCRKLDRIGSGRYDDLHNYVLIKLSRDLGIDYKSFAKNAPKLPILGFVELAKRTFTDFVPVTNSTIQKLQAKRLSNLFQDWLESECPRKRGCTKKSHTWCSGYFIELDADAIVETIATANQKRRRSVARDIAQPTAAGAARLRLVYSRE